MTKNLAQFGKAMTAIAAVLAFTSTQSVAQDVTAPPDPVADTSVQAQESSDPLAPEPAAEQAPVTTQAASPPPSKPKVEARTTATQRARPTTASSAARPTASRATATAPEATVAPPAVETAAPAEPLPPMAAEPAAPLAAAPPANDSADTLLSDPLIPVGAGALGLLVLGGAGIAMHRRKRRREDAEFEARQQALAAIDDEPAPLELDPAAEVKPGPAFARPPAPMHDPVPAMRTPATKVHWGSPTDADFMIRRDANQVKRPVEQD